MTTYTTSRVVKTNSCYAMIVTGPFDDLDTIATIIASTINPGHLHVALLQYPAGPRLQVTSDESYPDQAHDLVEHYIDEGVPLTIANGQEPLPVYLYVPEEAGPPPAEELPF